MPDRQHNAFDTFHGKRPERKAQVQQDHTPDGPAEEFINEYDQEPESLPDAAERTRSTSPGENRGKVQKGKDTSNSM